MLRITGLDVFHGDAQALDGVSLEVGEGDIVALPAVEIFPGPGPSPEAFAW